MSHWQGFLVGLSSGIIATLIADNPRVRFLIEKALRKLIGKHSIALKLISFTNICSDGGMFMTHCIEIANNMWLTPEIPRVYVLSKGGFADNAHAYKPFIYFR